MNSILFDEDSVIKEDVDHGIEGLFIAHELSKLSPSNLQKFIASENCRQLVKLGILEKETIDSIENKSTLDDSITISALNHIKNKGDGRFNEIINLKKELDKKITEVVEEFEDEAKKTVEKHKDSALDKVDLPEEDK